MNAPAKFWSLSFFLILVAMLDSSTPVSAAPNLLDISGTGARNFTDATIWDSGAAPGTADFPVMAMGNGTTDYVYLDTSATVTRINVGNANSGGLEIRSGATLATTATGSSQSNIGPGGATPGVGYLTIKSGATLTQAGLLYLGLNPNGTGNVTLENGGTHTLTGALAVRDGTGTYTMLGGTLTVGDFFQVARNGHGTFTQAGGTLQANRNAAGQGMLLAGAAGSSGLYEISGGSLTVAGTNTGVINGATAGGGAGIFRIVGSAPTVTIGTNYDQRAGASFEVVIDAGGISPMNVGGNALLDGILGASFTTIPSLGQQFTIMNYTGTLTGKFATFDSLVDSPLGPDTVQLSINYGTNERRSVVLTVVPEPSVFILLGSLGLIMSGRRRRNS